MNVHKEITFLLDGELVRAGDLAPSTTLLCWLREGRGRTGTKEGCAEGDCGACTVVLAELQEGRLRWRSVNACIQFLPTLHGKALFTVESLRGADGTLHPAQRAMVECHGSQCGFCTPGFVMSLFALYQNKRAPLRGDVAEALSGNLCRCTGYRPILDAARRMYELPPPGSGTAATGLIDEGELTRRLEALDDEHELVLEHPEGRFFAPRTLDRFAELAAAHPEAVVLAGGTDIGLWVTQELRELPVLLYLGRVRPLDRIVESDGWLEIGAAVRLEDGFPALETHYPEMGELYRRFGSQPIRNAGTLCGNIANGSPIGDAMPALIALGAEVVLRRAGAVRRIPLEALYLGYQKKDLAPGEFVEAVRIPARPAGRGFHFRAYKVSKRHDQDISAVFAGFAIHERDGVIESARLAFGGMAATPKRAAGAEAALIGRAFDANAVAIAAEALAGDFTPLTDMRASAAYRLAVAKNLLTRFRLETIDGAADRLHRQGGASAARMITRVMDEEHPDEAL